MEEKKKINQEEMGTNNRRLHDVGKNVQNMRRSH